MAAKRPAPANGSDDDTMSLVGPSQLSGDSDDSTETVRDLVVVYDGHRQVEAPLNNSVASISNIPDQMNDYQTIDPDRTGAVVGMNTPSTSQPGPSLNPVPIRYRTGHQRKRAKTDAERRSAEFSHVIDNSNRWRVDGRVYPKVIPRAGYRGNARIKHFLEFFNTLDPEYQTLINDFIAFQDQGRVVRIVKQHNDEISEYRRVILQLEDRLRELEPVDQNEHPETRGPYCPNFPEWETQTVSDLFEDTIEVERTDVYTNVDIPPQRHYPKPTAIQDIKVRYSKGDKVVESPIRSIPGFSPNVLLKIINQGLHHYLLDETARLNGNAFKLVASVICGVDKTRHLSDYQVTMDSILPVIQEAKKLKKRKES